MSRALWWFRWASVLTVLMGFAYGGNIVGSDAHNGGGSAGGVFGSFFLIWTVTWGLMYACQIPGKGALDKGPVLAVIYVDRRWSRPHGLFLRFNDHGWESNRLLAIGIGGGIGWMMMLNVWGVIWRIQKRIIQWTADNAANGTPMPEKAKGHGAAGISDVAHELLAFVPDAFSDGRGEPLPDVWQVRSSEDLNFSAGQLDTPEYVFG